MLGRFVLIGLVALLLTGYGCAPLLSLTSRRRRDARALRRFLLRDISSGRRSRDDALVDDVIIWCDTVARTGHDLPL